MNVHIRLAKTAEDRAAIYRMRYELYVEQQGLFHDTADHERRFLTDEDDAHSHLLLAEVDGQLAGTLRLTSGPFSEDLRKTYELRRLRGIVEEERIMVVTRVLVRPEFRGGSIMIQFAMKAMEIVAAASVELTVANCEVHLLNHWMMLGYRPYGKLYNHQQNGVLVSIGLATADLDRLRQLRSPLLQPLEQHDVGLHPQRLERLNELFFEGAAVHSKMATPTGDYLDEISQLLEDEKGSAGSYRIYRAPKRGCCWP